MKKYKRLQIIKHALEHYITRPNANDKDLHTEKVLLEQVTQEVDDLKEKYGIG